MNMNESGSGADSSGIRPKKIRIWFTAILLVLVMLICAAVAVLMPLYQAYRKSHMDVPIVTRPDESYTRPPEPTFDPDPTVPDDTDDTDPSGTTEPPVTEPDDTKPADTTHPPVKVPGIYKVDKKDPDIENILILGTDSRNVNTQRGRSDSIIVASLNKRTKEVQLISFLRDTYVPIEGHGWNKINAAYSLGGVALSVNTINDLFGLDIQKFVIVNFSGASTFVDACGGVDMELSNIEIAYLTEYLKHTLEKNDDGSYHLDGSTALDYMRMRKLPKYLLQRFGKGAGDDFGRTERQRKVMMAIYTQAMAKKDVTQMYNLVREGFNLVKTNISLSEMLDLAGTVISFGSDLQIRSKAIPGNGYTDKKIAWVPKNIGGVSVLWIEDLSKAKDYVVSLVYGS